MLKNRAAWLAFMQHSLGRDVAMKDVLLVTGCDLTAEWATTSFIQKRGHASITLEAGDPMTASGNLSFWATWATSVSIPNRRGPVPVRRPETAMQETEAMHAPSAMAFDQCAYSFVL